MGFWKWSVAAGFALDVLRYALFAQKSCSRAIEFFLAGALFGAREFACISHDVDFSRE